MLFSPHRASFRQLLLVAFLSVAGLLAGVALRGLFTLERLLQQSRASADQAVELSAAAQQLAERGVAMERAARQYMVLDDPLLRQRYDEARSEAERLLNDRLVPQLAASAAAPWRDHSNAIVSQLNGPRATRPQREANVASMFRDLDGATAAIAAEVRDLGVQRNQRLQAELEEARVGLGHQVAGAIVFAALAALIFGLWLSRPMKRLERAVVALGESRFEQPVRIGGPADLRTLGQRLEWLRLRLKELDEDKARFLRHISHELKTPLAALREGVALLEDGVAGRLSEDQREVARILGHNTRTLQTQIEDLLRFNAAAFEARRLVRRPLELAALCRLCVEAQRLQWQARQLRVQVHGGPLEVQADAEKLGAAIANLLSNAIRFSPAGASIGLTVSQVPGWAHIDVADAGPGVAEADRKRVFEPFYRGERQPENLPEGAVRGTGIGLSIVHEYVQAHGGRVELLPQAQGTGARFRIELPLTE